MNEPKKISLRQLDEAIESVEKVLKKMDDIEEQICEKHPELRKKFEASKALAVEDQQNQNVEKSTADQEYEMNDNRFQEQVMKMLTQIQAQNREIIDQNKMLSQRIESMQKVFDMIVRDYLEQIVRDLDEITEYGEGLQKGEVTKEDIEGLSNRIHLAQETIAMLDNSPAVSHASVDMQKIINGAVAEIKFALEKERDDVKAHITDGVNHLTDGTNKITKGLEEVESYILSDIKNARNALSQQIQKSAYDIRRAVPGAGRDPMR